jgi:hypothetical protein
MLLVTGGGWVGGGRRGGGTGPAWLSTVRSRGDSPNDRAAELRFISVVPAAVPFVVHNSSRPLESAPLNSTMPSLGSTGHLDLSDGRCRSPAPAKGRHCACHPPHNLGVSTERLLKREPRVAVYAAILCLMTNRRLPANIEFDASPPGPNCFTPRIAEIAEIAAAPIESFGLSKPILQGNRRQLRRSMPRRGHRAPSCRGARLSRSLWDRPRTTAGSPSSTKRCR